MKGLFLKDILNLKQQYKIYAIMVAIWLMISFANGNSYFFAGVIMLFTLIIPISSISYDEMAKWDRYALTMPVSKSNIVVSKYLLSFSCTAIGGILSLIVTFITSKDTGESLITTLAIMSLGIILISIMLPFMFKLGVEKARMIMFIVFMIPTVIGLIASRLDIPAPSESLIKTVLYLLPIIAIFIVSCSILISINIYNNKEF